MTDTIVRPFHAAHDAAPVPATREEATRDAWVRHYAAQALAAHAAFEAAEADFRQQREAQPGMPFEGSRPDLGFLSMLAQASMSAAVAFLGPLDAPTRVWDLTPEAGALDGEWEDWLVGVLVRYGINPGHIHPSYDAADFAEAVQR